MVLRKIRRAFAYREVSVLLILLGEVGLFYAFTGRGFINLGNLALILRYSSFYAIAAVGMAMIIITGGIDLSPGSVMALTAVVTGYCYVNLGWPLVPSCALGLMVGVSCGALASLMIVKIKLPPFIATLGTMGLARGLAFIIMMGKTYIDLSEKIANTIPGDTVILGVKFPDLLNASPVVLMIIIAVFFHWFMVRTKWGRQICAVGGNETAAAFSGVKVGRMKTIVYTTGAILAAVSGLILAVVFGQGSQNLAMGYELDVIAAAVVGGASLSGGKGSVLGAVIGALIFGVLHNGLIHFSLIMPGAPYYERFIVGAAVVIIVIIDQFTARRQAKMT